MLNGWQVFIRLLLTLIFCGLIGLEREVHKREAGLRTHVLVGLASCLITLTSLYVSDIYRDIVPVDPSRIAANIVTGIGFLGAGAIIRYGEAIKGLTTAATLWIVAALGMSVGIGFYFAATVTAIFTLVVLVVLRRFENLVHNNQDKHIEI